MNYKPESHSRVPSPIDAAKLNHFLEREGMVHFRIGDYVAESIIYEAWKADAALNPPPSRDDGWSKKPVRLSTPPVLVITGRDIEQCYGGTQVHYLVRSTDSKGMEATKKYAPFELVPFEDVYKVQEKVREAQTKYERERKKKD